MDLPIFHVLSLHSIAHLGFGRCSGEDHRDRRLDGSRPRLQGKQVAASLLPFGIGGRLVEDQIGFEDNSIWVGVSTVGLRTFQTLWHFSIFLDRFPLDLGTSWQWLRACATLACKAGYPGNMSSAPASSSEERSSMRLSRKRTSPTWHRALQRCVRARLGVRWDSLTDKDAGVDYLLSALSAWEETAELKTFELFE